jgi:ribose 5-phosphate isomerase A
MNALADAALTLVTDGARVGLGSGRTAAVFIGRLGRRVREGFRASGVATSRAAEHVARAAGIPLIELGADVELDLTVDGADEVAPDLDLIKGLGGALVRERIVAAASRRQVILVAAAKLVRRLGERCSLPIEVIPFGAPRFERTLAALGLTPTLRMDPAGDRPLLTDNGNVTFDCAIAQPLADGTAARNLEAALLALPGVVDTGLFLGTAERVLVGRLDGRVDTLLRTTS